MTPEKILFRPAVVKQVREAFTAMDSFRITNISIGRKKTGYIIHDAYESLDELVKDFHSIHKEAKKAIFPIDLKLVIREVKGKRRGRLSITWDKEETGEIIPTTDEQIKFISTLLGW